MTQTLTCPPLNLSSRTTLMRARPPFCFNLDTTAAWCQLWVQPEGGARTLVMQQQGTNFLDRDLGLQLLAEQAPKIAVEWSQDLDYDSFQIGLTNNRSTVTRHMLIGNVVIEDLTP